MSDFLTGYGAADARRERFLKWLIGGLVALALIGAVSYYFLRDFRQERQAKLFFELLGKKDYQAAYRLWGCTPETPCRDYSFEKFNEDWGPKSPHADLSGLKVFKTRSCDGGVIRIVDISTDDRVMLFVDRTTLAISFAPWEFCNPRWQAPTPGGQ